MVFNLLVMEEDKELERQMLNLSSSIFDTEISRWIISVKHITILFSTLTVRDKVTCAFRPSSSSPEKSSCGSTNRFFFISADGGFCSEFTRRYYFLSTSLLFWPCSGLF